MAASLWVAACGGPSNGNQRVGAPQPATATSQPAGSVITTAPAAASNGSAGPAVCDLIRTYRQRLSDLEQHGLGDPGRLHQFLSDVISALDQAVRVAPADVAADVTTTRDATKKYADLLATAGYDPTKLPPGADNPLLRPDVQAASERLDGYAQHACSVGN